jgi:hypothetical protein
MIMWIPQLISCGIHMKSEINVDQATACARAPWERGFNTGIARFRRVIEQVVATAR